MAKLYNFGPKPLECRVLPIMHPLHHLCSDHAPFTSSMHHFILGTKIPHSLLNAQQITSSLHMPIKHYITSFGVFFVLYLFQRESFFLVFHHPFFSSITLYLLHHESLFYVLHCFLHLVFLVNILYGYVSCWSWSRSNKTTYDNGLANLIDAPLAMISYYFNIWFGLNFWLSL